MSQSFSNGGPDEHGDVYPASFDCDCGLSLSWPVTEGVPASEDPVAAPMLEMIAEHDAGGCRQARRVRESKRVALLTTVRRRDGDQCRVCRAVVSFAYRRSGSAGAYYLSNPAAPAIADEAFVICRDHLDASASLQMVPAPSCPVYSKATWEWLSKHRDGEGIVNENSEHGAAREGNADKRSVNHSLASVVGEHRVRIRRINRRFGRAVSPSTRKPSGRKLLEVSIDPGALDALAAALLKLQAATNYAIARQANIGTEAPAAAPDPTN